MTDMAARQKASESLLTAIDSGGANDDAQSSEEILRSLGNWLWNETRLVGLLVSADDRVVLATTADDLESGDAEWLDNGDSLLALARRLRGESLRCVDATTTTHTQPAVSVDESTAAILARPASSSSSTTSGWFREEPFVFFVDDKAHDDLVGVVRAVGGGGGSASNKQLLLLLLSKRVPIFENHLPFAEESSESVAPSPRSAPLPARSNSMSFSSTTTIITAAMAKATGHGDATVSKSDASDSATDTPATPHQAPQHQQPHTFLPTSSAIRAPSSLGGSPQRGNAATTATATNASPALMAQIETRAVIDAVGEMSDKNVLIVNASGDVVGVSPIAEAVLERCCDSARKVDRIFAGGFDVWQKLCDDTDASPDGRVVNHPFLDGTPCVLRLQRLQCNVVVVVFEAIGTTNVNDFWHSKYGTSLSRRSSNNNNNNNNNNSSNNNHNNTNNAAGFENNGGAVEHDQNDPSTATTPSKHRRRVRLRRQRSALAESATIDAVDETTTPAATTAAVVDTSSPSSPMTTAAPPSIQQESTTTTTTTTMAASTTTPTIHLPSLSTPQQQQTQHQSQPPSTHVSSLSVHFFDRCQTSRCSNALLDTITKRCRHRIHRECAVERGNAASTSRRSTPIDICNCRVRQALAVRDQVLTRRRR
jgi:hypothetical protein